MEQTKFSFDKVTITKIAKGAMISATGAGAIAALNYLGTIQISNPDIAAFVAFFVPFMVNLIKEYVRGS